MSNPKDDNRSYLLRLWRPALVLGGFLAILFVVSLAAGGSGQLIPIGSVIALTVGLSLSIRWYQKRRVARMLQTPDPDRFLRSFAASLRRMPHGAFFAAANSATILAFYGRFQEAERALESVAWETVPPLVQAQRSAARAAIAYAQGSFTEGLDYSVAASQQAVLDISAPGVRASELAFRTYRNLGLALAGRATDSTAHELRIALAQLPLAGQILAAWGLAVVAKDNGAVGEFQSMQAFIKKNAPYFAPAVEWPRAPAG